MRSNSSDDAPIVVLGGRGRIMDQADEKGCDLLERPYACRAYLGHCIIVGSVSSDCRRCRRRRGARSRPYLFMDLDHFIEERDALV